MDGWWSLFRGCKQVRGEIGDAELSGEGCIDMIALDRSEV